MSIITEYNIHYIKKRMVCFIAAANVLFVIDSDVAFLGPWAIMNVTVAVYIRV